MFPRFESRSCGLKTKSCLNHLFHRFAQQPIADISGTPLHKPQHDPVTSDSTVEQSVNASTTEESITCEKTVVPQQHVRKTQNVQSIISLLTSSHLFSHLPKRRVLVVLLVQTKRGEDGVRLSLGGSCEPMGGARGLFPCRGQDGATGMGPKLWLPKHLCAAWWFWGYFSFSFSKKPAVL